MAEWSFPRWAVRWKGRDAILRFSRQLDDERVQYIGALMPGDVVSIHEEPSPRDCEDILIDDMDRVNFHWSLAKLTDRLDYVEELEALARHGPDSQFNSLVRGLAALIAQAGEARESSASEALALVAHVRHLIGDTPQETP